MKHLQQDDMSKTEVIKAIQCFTLKELIEVIEVAFGRLRQLVAVSPQTDESEVADTSLLQWESAVMTNPSFSFLNDAAENSYTLEDGIPVSTERLASANDLESKPDTPRTPGQDSGKVFAEADFNEPLPDDILNSFLAPQ